ncbi:AP-2 complex subunit mu [Micractinium conductrix]|uniref:AP-2 complex subunit mu n=1 Tax=Micractinium conductrix TaxID=554055 RepID=A0A2P6VHS2_9CHLO|nr:AP-2 complex subunit mu [Micractinium conductrix]|eukprot:PSC73641.1 AP-2 complex subunit mu [Micractinium conductrix]
MALPSCNESLGALYFINGRGDVLIQRIYRDDIERNLASAFRAHVVNSRETDAASLAPVRQFGDASYCYLRASNVYLLAITKRNSNAMMVMQFLSRLVDLVRAYCNGEFSEEVVKGNFVLIYELLDEVLDHGYPQVTDPAVLKSFIFQKGWVTPATKKKREAESANATLQVTGAVGWRKDNLRYKKNEVFLDVVETVSMLMSAQGSVLRCDVQGRLVMKAFLSGMPDIKLGLNDKLEDVTFHPCVNLGRFNAEKVVSFVPPDGEFELMKYRCTEGITLPFKAVALITEHGRTRLDVTVKVKSTFPTKIFATNVVVLVPVPDQTARASFNLTAGKAKYDPKRHALVWKLKKFAGEAEHTLAASVELISTVRERKPWSRPPLAMNFQIPMHSCSGVKVQYLKVWEKSSYKVDKWVRKISKSGDYTLRI